MGRVRWEVSPAAVLLFALVWFFDDAGLISALFPAAVIHELGHVAALRLCASRPRRVSIGVFGVRLDYTGCLNRSEALFAAAAGPGAGLLYALAAGTGGEFFRVSAGISLALSVFNLLPVLPLDGGRILVCLAGERRAKRLSQGVSAALSVLGACCFALYRAPWAFAVGLWLAAYNCFRR